MVLIGIIYSIALMGQGLAQEQMLLLRDFFECAVCHHDLESIAESDFSCDAHIEYTGDDCAPSSCKTCSSACDSKPVESSTETAVLGSS